MTLVGHGLTGAALGLLATPRDAGWPRTLAMLVIFAALGNTPDLPLPGWGHNLYEVSHSLPVTLALVALLGAALWSWPATRRRLGGRTLLLGAAAWCSHLLLDSFYNHGKGVAIFWPLSRASLNLALPWFSTVRKPLWQPELHTFKVMAVELAFYGTAFLLVAGLRRVLFRRRGATDTNHTQAH